jgi:hypothetical protein
MTHHPPSEANPVARARQQELAGSGPLQVSPSGWASGQILIAARVDRCPQASWGHAPGHLGQAPSRPGPAQRLAAAPVPDLPISLIGPTS